MRIHVASSEHFSFRLSEKQANYADPHRKEGTLWGSDCKHAILIKISRTENLLSFDVGT
jgi:hypothetical protein